VMELSVDPSEGAASLKEGIKRLTGVPADRQKVMAKGLWKGTLKDEQDLAGLDWKDGMLIAMMGTSTGLSEPDKPIVFVEDMTDQEKQKVAAVLPPGLENLGNTCYMNATLQCLKAIPELRASLEASPLNPRANESSEHMTSSLKNLFKQMDTTTNSVTPTEYVAFMRHTFPQFARPTAQGGFSQQDADEFFNELLTVLSTKLTSPGNAFSFEDKSNAINALFGIEMSVDLKCIETDAEPIKHSSEIYLRLQCNITADIATLEQGIKLGLEADVEKNSEVLGRNCIWKQTRSIHKLPKYLAIQFNRFFWKRTPESRDHQGVSCKILKPVKFSFTLDIHDLCDDELKEILSGPRKAHAKKLMGIGRQEDVEMEEDSDLQAALRMSNGGGTAGVGIPPTFRGIYELFGVVTHKGRASDSGHYMGWVKQEGDDWICFDDENASACKQDDVGQLSGGGDYDMAYMVFYRVKE